MNILLSCLQSPVDYPIAPYRFWETYFKRGIEEAGHSWIDVPQVDWAFPLATSDPEQLDAWRTDTWSRVLDAVRIAKSEGRIDLFLGYLYPKMVDPAGIGAIRDLGIPCVNFFCDNLRSFGRIPGPFHCFDLHWVPEIRALPLYQEAGQKALHLPMPCWVPPEYRTPSTTEKPVALFAGSADPMRHELVGDAIRLGANIAVAGGGWSAAAVQRESPPRGKASRLLSNQVAFLKHHGIAAFARKIARVARPRHIAAIPAANILGRLDDDGYASAIRDSMIALGINRVETFGRPLDSPITYSRLRDIEAPMMGACYLTEWTDDLEVFYEIGREVEVYRNAAELADKVAALGKDPERRRRLRAKGQSRALADLSVRLSLEKIADEVGISRRH